jgi:hypothetical protein
MVNRCLKGVIDISLGKVSRQSHFLPALITFAVLLQEKLADFLEHSSSSFWILFGLFRRAVIQVGRRALWSGFVHCRMAALTGSADNITDNSSEINESESV